LLGGLFGDSFLLTLRLFGKQETFEAVDAEKAEVNI
jgi:hypothetical protein